MSESAFKGFRKADPFLSDDSFPRFFNEGLPLSDFGARLQSVSNGNDYLSGASKFAFAPTDQEAFVAAETKLSESQEKPVALAGIGTISLTAAGVAVTQNFDTLVNLAGTTTNTSLPTGWYLEETGGGARDNEQYAVDTGATTTGDIYSFGSAGSTDRAFGQIRTGTLIPTIGAQISNDTGTTLTSLLISYIGEQWRFGGLHSTVADKMDFQISFNATSLTTGTWWDVDALDFNAPVTGPSAGALDGNAAANRTAISGTISSANVLGFSIPNGATFWIRFFDVDASSSDDGLAIDDFSITAIADAGSPGTLSVNDVTLSEGNSGTTNFTFTVTRSGGTAGAVSATWTLANGTTDNADFTTSPQTGSVDFLDGETSKTITITVAGDTAVEGNDIFFLNLTNPTGGVTITDGQGLGTITNDDTGSPGVLSISDVTLAEGNSGATDFVFTVTRTGGTTGVVGATWESTDFTATIDDIVGSGFPSGTVTFADGETSRTFTIQVLGDTAREPDEQFEVRLSNPTGGATIGTGAANGNILNDDAPQLSIGDVTQSEGNSGTTNFTFTITRTSDLSSTTSVTWTLANGTTDNADFTSTPQTGTVNFGFGQSSRTITVTVAGDTTLEGNETFFVNLTNPTGGAVIIDGQGLGTITNDDAAPIANVWINEFHYDNAGTDANEFVEVAGLAGIDLTGWSIVLYNGSDGASYSTTNLSGALTNTSNGFGFVKIAYPTNSIQNGAPDGIALVDNIGRVVQFLSYEGTMTATNGPANGLTSTDIGVAQSSAAVGFTLQLTGTGSSYADFTWAANVANTEGAVNAGQTFLSGTDQGQISIRDASVTEGNSGTANLTFVVNRAGGFASNATVDWQVLLNGTANAADLAAGAVLTGTVTFGVNEFSRTITIPVQGDTTGEFNETLSIVLSNVTGNAAIADANATGTIINDDPVLLSIMQIQGESHTSGFVGQFVNTTGIVTAVAANGFYIQDATGDANARTSDAIFIFTSSAPTVAVGDGVTVSGTVAEFTGAAGALSLTQIASPSVTVNSSGNALPTALLIGTGGMLPPSDWIDDDGLTTYDPLTDGIDFWESLEGMRVTLDTPQVVANTNSFGETYAVVSGGSGASGVNAAGGIAVSPNSSTGQTLGDFNPEMIQIDDNATIFPGFTPNYTVGDRLSNVTGIVNYAFGAYEVLVTQAVTVTNDVTVARETTTLTGSATGLTMATYNVENLDPTDTRFTLLATDIVVALQAPDIIALQEIQDADGAGSGSNLSGAVTAQLLIDAIVAAGGPTYTYIEVAPTVANTTGGEPNGNIRPGFLYDSSRVSYIPGSLTQINDVAFTNSRSPLVASFSFNGQVITAINVHFTSRGGSEGLWGANQPPTNAGEAARTAQLSAVNAYVNNHVATNPAYEVALLGDFNGFYFEAEQLQLSSLVNVGVANLPEEELYSYLFEGNSQLLDNIYATAGLVAGSSYDAVHINALFNEATRPTDHDPQLALFAIPAGFTLFDTSNSNNLIGTPDEDSLFGLDQADLIDGLGSNDRLVGGPGADQLFGGDGDDTLYAESDDAVIDGGSGIDTVHFGASGVVTATLSGLEAIRLANGATITFTPAQFNAGFYDPIAQVGMATVSGNGSLVFNMDPNPITATLYLSGLSFAGGSSVTLTLNGSSGLDAIKGAPGVSNTINGGDEADQIRGGSLADTIDGGGGNDKLFGWSGADMLTGGAGSDQFRYFFATDSGTGAAADRITDFQIGTDKFNFVIIDADPITPDDQAFAFIGTVAFTSPGTGQIRYQDSGADLLVQVDVDGNGTVDMEVVLQGLAGQTLTSADFML